MKSEKDAEIAALKRERRALLRALKPFAREADDWLDTIPDRYRPGVTEPKSVGLAP